MKKVTRTFELYGKEYSLSTGELAKQASGAVVVTQGDTTVLVTAVISESEKDYDFFPLTVDFIEKMYAVGRIPGGYLKREAKPSDHGILTARMIDRPIRPGFADGFKQEVHIVATPLVLDTQDLPDCISVMGASAALMCASAPFDGPAACVRIGRNIETGEFIVNPTVEEDENSDLELTIAGTADYISMVEAGAQEISEEDMLAAMTFGQEAIKAFCEEQSAFLAEVAPESREWPVHVADPSIAARIEPFFNAMSAALKDADKHARMAKVDELKASIKENEFTEEERAAWGSDIAAELKSLEKHAMRAMVIETGERADGRTSTEIRPLHIVAGYLPRVHGSGLFQRGQTQALSVCTLGMLNEWQRLDTIWPEEGKRYMHQYNFPSYSVGETKPSRGPGRREIGHGALAERALVPVLPTEEEFPYAIRTVSETFESNGSTSQASICASTMSLMAAGVPIKKPVAGISCGLVTGETDDDYLVLTDIQGLEDFFGDMDFKVAGTHDGITAIQMDIKIHGLTRQIVEEAIARTKQAREYILTEVMEKAIAEPRKTVGEFAPKIIQMMIDPQKIGEVVGQRGKTINAIIDETGVKIDITDDGAVSICGTEQAMMDQAKKYIEIIASDFTEGQILTGKVVSIKDFGAFLEFAPGKEGLVHISKLAKQRVEKVEDVVSLGDVVKVVCMGKDKMGRVSFSIKDVPADAK